MRPRATRVRPARKRTSCCSSIPTRGSCRARLERPARYLQATEHAGVGIVGIQLLDANGEVARNTARAPTPLSMVGNSVGLDRLLPSVFPSHFVTEWAHDDTRTVDQVMGAFFLVRRTVFEALGGFDERFFVYFEDMDFAVRARKLGWSSVYLSTAQAFHRGQGTTDAATERRMFYFARSRVLYARKHFGALGALAVMLSTLFLEPLSVLSPRPARRVRRCVRSACFGKICRTSCGLGMLARELA